VKRYGRREGAVEKGSGCGGGKGYMRRNGEGRRVVGRREGKGKTKK